ncbi:hypothetical protein L1049_004786 [Liquidambar formosana]|uniref:Uncharacterized protein n=1 Tax=Liquidambar formosana TaxID=63359 RepID=A0AAP0RNR2_LIQFO
MTTSSVLCSSAREEIMNTLTVEHLATVRQDISGPAVSSRGLSYFSPQLLPPPQGTTRFVLLLIPFAPTHGCDDCV